MRKLFAKLREDITQFIGQRDDFAMIASCSDNDSGIVLQLLRDIEQSQASDIFLLFSDNFIQSNAFVSVAIERLREQHSLACQALAEKGQKPLPPLPAELSDESEAPHRRLQNAILFARSLLPREGGHRLVWAMFPQRIANRGEYLELVKTFAPGQGVEAWMAGIRIIFRDEPGGGEHASALTEARRVRLLNIDLGPAAMEASMRQEATDAELPEADRMQALLSLALLDAAHSRTQDAAAKYNVLLEHYQRTENYLMQAFVMNGYGDLFQRLADLDQARQWYECAVAPASAAKNPLLLTMIAKNLGDVSYKLGSYGAAEEYYDGVDKVSRVTLDAGSKVRALEWRGLSQEKQGKYESAIQSWEAAAVLSRTMNFPVFLKENLEHLRRLSSALGLKDKASAAEAELKNLPLEEAS
jgi:tetratricopeptide (TPR) repeat protein